MEEGVRARSEQLSKRLKIPLANGKAETPLALTVFKDHLGLAFSEDRPLRPYSVDFLSPEWEFRRRRGLRENKAFLQAVGVKNGARILDATAGFGQDSFLLAWGGANVTAVERSPVVLELLQDGLRRAFDSDSPWGAGLQIRAITRTRTP